MRRGYQKRARVATAGRAARVLTLPRTNEGG